MKTVIFAGDSLAVIRSFPDEPRQEIGHQIDLVQRGLEPDHWKPMAAIGPGVREIRVSGRAGEFRTIHVATFAEAIYVLHAFQKKTQRTAKRDLERAIRRYAEIIWRRR